MNHDPTPYSDGDSVRDLEGALRDQAEVIEMEINPPLVRAKPDNDSWEKVHKGNDH